MKQLSKNIILFILPFLMGIAILFIIPVDKKFSYNFVKGECNDKANWIYNRIFENETKIDIAFIGASHTACAIMDEHLENELFKLGRKELKAANLGYCRGGRDIQYVMLKDLFKQKEPKILVIDVTEDEPKKSHPVFAYLAESNDLWGSFIFFNQRYFINIWKGIVVRFEYLKFRLFQNDYKTNHDQPNFGYQPSSQIAAPEIFKQNEIAWKNRFSKWKPKGLRNIELNYSKHYIKRIVELAHRHHCKVLFLYLPESGSKLATPLESNFYNELGKLITIPDSIITNKLNWMDATHFNDSGALQVTDFLTIELSKIR